MMSYILQHILNRMRFISLQQQRMIWLLVSVTVLYLVYQFFFIIQLDKHSTIRGIQQKNKYMTDKHIENTVERNDNLQKVQFKNEPPKHQTNAQLKPPNRNAVLSHKKNASQLTTAGNFMCRSTKVYITADKVNDDYCDCPDDGSDEPETNACSTGKYLCKKTAGRRPSTIPSGWVNDGICDCCDGSDEWQGKKLDVESYLGVEIQTKIKSFLSPCPNNCQ